MSTGSAVPVRVPKPLHIPQHLNSPLHPLPKQAKFGLTKKNIVPLGSLLPTRRANPFRYEPEPEPVMTTAVHQTPGDFSNVSIKSRNPTGKGQDTVIDSVTKSTPSELRTCNRLVTAPSVRISTFGNVLQGQECFFSISRPLSENIVLHFEKLRVDCRQGMLIFLILLE